ncbi:MAG: tRNA 2-thiouridine(34) synthase MnmA [Methylacidiphilales bacterium]|nr:tRNA 2-thiouridine(34) synthase MnmA [Candidatus Methylacidiphilales bacterium]
MSTIAVALSGGVDSSVSALLLRNQGNNIIGMHMTNWEEEVFSPCSQDRDLSDARQIATFLNIPFYPCNFTKEYYREVFLDFIDSYQKGYTPNPDVFCNKEIKFKVLLEKARLLGADSIATGHYARIQYVAGRYELHRASDESKDQSYFLYILNEELLAIIKFPLATTHKSQTRDLAKLHGLHTYAKKDSTGICFIGEKNFRPFLKKFITTQKGEIKCLESGRIIGEHEGSVLYTIGQRTGLGIGGVSGAKEKPWYVAKKNIGTNTIYVVQGEHPALYYDTLITNQPHWIHKENYAAPPKIAEAKIRYRQLQQSCEISKHSDGGLQVSFRNPQRAVAQGQSVVFYQDTHCLGGSVIARAENNYTNTN